LVPPPFRVVDIFANDSPIILDEGGLPKDLVGMAEAVQNEPGFGQRQSAEKGICEKWVGILMCDALLV
jgi:hypothetical protein